MMNGQLTEFALSILSARILTVFYMRSFRISKMGKLMLWESMLCLFLILLDFFDIAANLLAAVVSVYALFMRKNLDNDLVKCYALAATIYMSVFCNVSLMYLSRIAVLLAFSQLLRNPVWLKEKLREPRIIAGPMYTIVAVSGLRFINPANLWVIFPVSCSFVATVFFRPDNNEMLNILDRRITYSRKRQTHGLLMFISMKFYLVPVVFEMSYVSLFVATLGIAGILQYAYLKSDRVLAVARE